MDPDDPYDLHRFISAQEETYQSALSEVKDGAKRTHWMWYIFPQIEGLGQSPTAKYYAIRGVEEAREYLKHPVLGIRLIECAEAVLAVRGRSASEIFSYPDDLKLRSSMTLFASVAEPDSVFSRVLDRYFGGRQDAMTVSLLGKSRGI